jgi:hypothetical protein
MNWLYKVNMGVHTQNSPDWGIDFLDREYFATHLKCLRDAETEYLTSLSGRGGATKLSALQV